MKRQGPHQEAVKSMITSLPASLALFIWVSNSSLVWHATTTPSSAAILLSSSPSSVRSRTRL
uniref:Thioredoxin H-type n=1 Tax=Arundo donax TaxID=35708 RepID=A0A0A9F142_ARUDO